MAKGTGEPSGPESQTTLGVSLSEAARLLGVTEAAVLMRIFQRSLPSSIERDGGRRVPLEAIDGALTSDGGDTGRRPAIAAAPAEGEGWWSVELRDARERIAALEAKASDESVAALAAIQTLTRELRDTQTRMAALEVQATRRSVPYGWGWLWAISVRLTRTALSALGRETAG